MDKRMGRPPLPEGKAKAKNYVFRVSPHERKLLDEIGNPHKWRDFCMLVAEFLEAQNKGVKPSFRPDDLTWLVFGGSHE